MRLQTRFINGDLNFVLYISFIKDNEIFTDEDFIRKIVYDIINRYWKNKTAEDLLLDLTTNYDNNNTKKKKKKKKKKNSEKNVKIDKNEGKKDTIENTDKKENDVNNNGNSIINCENKKEVIKVDDNINEKTNNENNNKKDNNNDIIVNKENNENKENYELIKKNENEEKTSTEIDHIEKKEHKINEENNHNNYEENKMISQKEELNEKKEQKDENSNKKKKEKDFFLYPVTTNKKKKNKNKKKDKKSNNNNNDKTIKNSTEGNYNNTESEEQKNIIEENNKNQEKINVSQFSFDKTENHEKNDKYKKQKNDFDFLSKQKNKFNMGMNLNKNNNQNYLQYKNNNNFINSYNSYQNQKDEISEYDDNNNGNNGYYNPNKIESNISRSKEDNKYLLAGSNFPRFTSFYFNSKKKRNYRKKQNKDYNRYSVISNNIIEFSEEINENTKKVESNKQILQQIREKYIKKIYQEINIILNNEKIDFLCSFYGSNISGLSIENSDIDIMVKLKQNKNEINYINRIMDVIVYNFKKNNIKYITNIIPIYTASVPVIKLECDLSNDEYFSKEINDLINNCNLSYNDITKLFFDITFFEVENEHNKIPSELMIDYIKDKILLYPQIIDIMYIMKRFLFNRKLNKSYQGGISSYSLFLLTLAFMKYFTKNYDIPPIGSLLIEYLNHYSNFNFDCSAIQPNKDDINDIFYINDKNSFFNKNNLNIIDPITGMNVARSTFKIDEIKKAFKEGYNIIISNLYIKDDRNDNGNKNKRKILDNFFAK